MRERLERTQVARHGKAKVDLKEERDSLQERSSDSSEQSGSPSHTQLP